MSAGCLVESWTVTVKPMVNVLAVFAVAAWVCEKCSFSQPLNVGICTCHIKLLLIFQQCRLKQLAYFPII